MSRHFYPFDTPIHKFPISVIVIVDMDCNGMLRFFERISHQTHQAFELIVVAQNISSEAKCALLQFQAQSEIDIKIIVDKCSIAKLLNRAVIAATHSYLVFTTTQNVPAKEFLSMLMQKRYGQRCLMVCMKKSSYSASLPKSVAWALHSFYHLLVFPFQSILACGATWNWSGVGCWKRDVIAVNGFNDKVSFSLLGTELCLRLYNSGVRVKIAPIVASEGMVSVPFADGDQRNISPHIVSSVKHNRLDWISGGIDSIQG